MERRQAVTHISAGPLWGHVESGWRESRRGSRWALILPNPLAPPPCFLLHTTWEWSPVWGPTTRWCLLSNTGHGISKSSPFSSSKFAPPDARQTCPKTKLWAGSIEHQREILLDRQREGAHGAASTIWQLRQVLGTWHMWFDQTSQQPVRFRIAGGSSWTLVSHFHPLPLSPSRSLTDLKKSVANN